MQEASTHVNFFYKMDAEIPQSIGKHKEELKFENIWVPLLKGELFSPLSIIRRTRCRKKASIILDPKPRNFFTGPRPGHGNQLGKFTL